MREPHSKLSFAVVHMVAVHIVTVPSDDDDGSEMLFMTAMPRALHN